MIDPSTHLPAHLFAIPLLGDEQPIWCIEKPRELPAPIIFQVPSPQAEELPPVARAIPWQERLRNAIAPLTEQASQKLAATGLLVKSAYARIMQSRSSPPAAKDPATPPSAAATTTPAATDAPLPIMEMGAVAEGGNSSYIGALLQALRALPDFYHNVLDDNQGEPLSPHLGEDNASLQKRATIRQATKILFETWFNKQTISAESINQYRQLFIDYGWLPQAEVNSLKKPEDFAATLFQILQTSPFSYPSNQSNENHHSETSELLRSEESGLASATLLTLSAPPSGKTSLKQLPFADGEFLDSISVRSYQIPPLLPIILERTSSENEASPAASVAIPQDLDIPISGKKQAKAQYSLVSLIIEKFSASGEKRYGTLSQESLDGKRYWIEFDGSKVIVHKNDSFVSEQTQKRSVMLFYRYNGIAY